jgi:hypothetical protein
MEIEELSDPAVRSVVAAMLDGDRDGFYAAFTGDAKLTDDGNPQDLHKWAEREVFRAHGRLEVATQLDKGRNLVGRFRSDQWDFPTTFWRFQVRDGRVSRLDVGQS